MRRFLLVLAASTSLTANAAGDDFKTTVRNALPNATIGDIRPSPVAGIFEVEANGQIVYVTADGKFLFAGDLIDLTARMNLTERRQGERMLAAIDALGEGKMILIGPKKPKHVVTVFTDVECPYCAKLHLEVPELNKNGIQVRYIFYPRAGENSDSFKKAIAIWCAKDRVAALGAAKAGKKVEMKTCANPVLEHLNLARALSLRGTPTIVLETGEVIPGYLPASKLLTALEAGAKGRAAP